MATNNVLTYGQVFQMLFGLGYTSITTTWQGHPKRVFKHQHYDKATIILPDAESERPIESMYISGVRGTLKAHGIIEEPTEGLFCQTIPNDDNHVQQG